MQKVNLTLFKTTGKYGYEGSYQSGHESLGDIWDEVRHMQRTGTLPGLCPNAGKELYILVNAPGHEHDHPRLILPIEVEK